LKKPGVRWGGRPWPRSGGGSGGLPHQGIAVWGGFGYSFLGRGFVCLKRPHNGKIPEMGRPPPEVSLIPYPLSDVTNHIQPINIYYFFHKTENQKPKTVLDRA
jgi:hypothetical protein